jgi:hypothetical protein
MDVPDSLTTMRGQARRVRAGREQQVDSLGGRGRVAGGEDLAQLLRGPAELRDVVIGKLDRVGLAVRAQDPDDALALASGVVRQGREHVGGALGGVVDRAAEEGVLLGHDVKCNVFLWKYVTPSAGQCGGIWAGRRPREPVTRCPGPRCCCWGSPRPVPLPPGRPWWPR